MSKLNNTRIKAIKSNEKNQKLYDGNGLFLFVSKSGTKSWRIKYYFNNKEKLYTIGKYPIISLAEAREETIRIKKLIAQNIDPMEQKKEILQEIIDDAKNTFGAVANEWFNVNSSQWRDSYKKRLLSSLNNDLLPYLSDLQINSITVPQLLEVLRKIEARGALESTRKAKILAGQIFKHAIETGRTDIDITSGIRNALKKPQTKHHACIIDENELGILLVNIDNCTSSLEVKTALKIIPYVFVRSGELCNAEWSEFNFITATWVIPAKRMKTNKSHTIPLAKQVIDMLMELKQSSKRNTKYLFPSLSNSSKPITTNSLLCTLRRMGYDKDTISIHGFRATASTLLNSQDYNADWIEKQLSHSDKDRIRGTYNHAQYLDNRRKMMNDWANFLDNLKNKQYANLKNIEGNKNITI